jgi:hypothetical protein
MPLNRIPLAGVLVAIGACSSVKAVQPAQFIPQAKPQMVWVTYTDNSFVPVSSPQMVGDTLKGTWGGLGEPLVIPLDQIQSVQARLPDHKRTIILFTVLGVAFTGVGYTLATAGNSGDPSFNGCGRTKGIPNPDC